MAVAAYNFYHFFKDLKPEFPRIVGFSTAGTSFIYQEVTTEVGCKNVTFEASSSNPHLTFSVRFPKVSSAV